MTDLEIVKNEIKNAFEKYMKAYFSERDLDKTTALFSKDITGFGTGGDEIGLEPGQFQSMYIRDLENAPGPIEFSYRSLKVVSISTTAGLVSALIDIKMEIDSQPVEIEGLRSSIIFEKRENDWLMLHKHISLPTELHEEGESYPLEMLRKQNRLLEEQVRERTRQVEARNEELETALGEVKMLSGLLPICSSCKQIRDEQGVWHQIEGYISTHSEAKFSHGICPKCMSNLYPGYEVDSGKLA